MNKNAFLLGAVAIGVLGLAMAGGSKAPAPGPSPKGPVPPPVRPVPTTPPPLTLTPKGRYLTPFERFVMGRYFPVETLNAAKLWFGRPKSSFTQETDSENGVTTEAVATKNGIYFQFENHELASPYELALLAHELVHVEQFRSDTTSPVQSENEVRAYQMQIAVKQDTENVLDGLKEQWDGARYS